MIVGVKKTRRTSADIDVIKAAMIEALEEDNPMTVRQVFYRLVSNGVIPKTEAAYKSTVVRLLGTMRRSGEIPFSYLADNTRWMRKPRTHDSLQDAIEETARHYRRAIWNDQDAYVEIWLEKDALAGVLLEETAKWDVPLMVNRGYASLSYLHSAAETIAAVGKPAFLYYFGDHDPSGRDAERAAERDLRDFAPKADITFRRMAVTREQIVEMDLPTRPTKATDSRSKNFEGESVEVDAIPPKTLRKIVAECIIQHVDGRTYRESKRVEAMERETLQNWSDHVGQWGLGPS